MFTVREIATDCIVFVGVVFLCAQDNSGTAAVSLMKFCTDMFLDNRTIPIKFQGHVY